jgi:hypothetical protein
VVPRTCTFIDSPELYDAERELRFAVKSRKEDLWFALTRCWSGGDSNRRSSLQSPGAYEKLEGSSRVTALKPIGELLSK